MDESLQTAARSTATRAAEEAGVRVADVHDLADLHRMSALFDQVWGRGDEAGTAMPTEVLRAMEHAGNQVTAAFDSGQMVGATAALLGRDPGDGGTYLHSHVTGVAQAAQGRGVGRALKQYQRAWSLRRGITRVRWTYDPLIRRNAVFNLVKLGARAVGYLEDVYGAMEDARNAGLPTDRLVVDWDLTERRVVLAAEGRAPAPTIDALRGRGAAVVLEVGEDDAPRTTASDAVRLLAQVPADIESIRASDRDLAVAWAEAVRTTLGAAVRGGYRVTGVTRDGWYILSSADRLEELTR